MGDRSVTSRTIWIGTKVLLSLEYAGLSFVQKFIFFQELKLSRLGTHGFKLFSKD